MPKFTEKSLVEDYIIEKLIEKGWRFVPASELERESFSQSLLLNNLVRAIKRLNTDKGIGDEELKHVLNELKLKGSGNEGLKQILNYLRISDSTINYEIVHRNIKYPRLEFKTGKLLVVLPKDHKDCGDLIEKHKGWIFK